MTVPLLFRKSWKHKKPCRRNSRMCALVAELENVLYNTVSIPWLLANILLFHIGQRRRSVLGNEFRPGVHLSFNHSCHASLHHGERAAQLPIAKSPCFCSPFHISMSFQFRHHPFMCSHSMALIKMCHGLADPFSLSAMKDRISESFLVRRVRSTGAMFQPPSFFLLWNHCLAMFPLAVGPSHSYSPLPLRKLYIVFCIFFDSDVLVGRAPRTYHNVDNIIALATVILPFIVLPMCCIPLHRLIIFA